MSFPTVASTGIFGGWEQLGVDLGDNGFFLELAAKIQVLRFLEEECVRQEEFWGNRMRDLAAVSGRHDVALGKLPAPRIQRVKPSNVYTGARPSLLQSPIDFWPSITVRCGDLRPDRGDQKDQYNTFICDLYVEIMCYAGPVRQSDLHLQEGIDAEGNVNLQTHLLSSAVQVCMSRDPGLGGAIFGFQNAPTIRPSFPTAVPGYGQERAGDYYLYQGRQHHYLVTRNSY